MRPKYLAALTLSLAAFLPGTAPAQTSTPQIFVPVTPCRVIDTRTNGPEISAGGTRDIAIPSSPCGIPASASAYSLNVTVVPNAQLGYLTIWPTGQTMPVVSTLNSDGRIKANAAIVPAGTNGSVTVYASDATQVIIDIDGYFIPDVNSGAGGLQFFPVTPCRIVDTRNTGGRIPAGGTSQFTIIGNCGIPSTAQAFSLNFTAVPPGPLTYITVWPASQSMPVVSTLNATTGAITANAAIVPAGTNGITSVYASDSTDLIIDVNGYFAPSMAGGLDLYNLTPCRVLDTRNGGSGSPFSGELTVNVSSNSCLSGASAPQAYVLNATVVPPGPMTYLSLWPDGTAQPTVSTLNAIDGAITSNMALVPTSNGSVDAYASNPTQLIVDISGYFAVGPEGGGCGSSCPPPPCTGTPCAFISGASIGENLQVLVPVTLSPTPTSLTTVTIISYSSNVLVSDSASVVGGASTTVTLLAGTSSTGVYVQALGNSGTAVIGATAPGYGEGEATINLSPSAFVLQTPTGTGGNFTIGTGATAQLTVSAAMLNSSGGFLAYQQVRPGANPTVTFSIGDPSVGSVSPSSLSFGAGDLQELTTFTGGTNANASTTISINEPSGFSTPSDGSSHAQVTLIPPVLSCTGTLAVGFNLAATGQCSLGSGVAQTDTVVTLTSGNPSALLFAPISFAVAGTPTMTVIIPAGSNVSGEYLIIGAASSGTATYTATSALGNATETITLLQTGFVLVGPTGVGGNFSTTFPGADSGIFVETAQLDGSGSPLLSAPLAPGVTVSVNVTSSSTSVGQIVGSPAVITAGNNIVLLNFQPTGMGTTTISEAVPSGGYVSPGLGSSLVATVGIPTVNLSVSPVAVGQNLELPETLFLSATPNSDLSLTLQASGSIKLSATGTDPGSSSLTLTIPAGGQSAIFYVYGQASSGTASITATASGYTSASASVTLGPSAFVVVGPSGTSLLMTPLASGPQPLAVTGAVLDGSGNYIFMEPLAGSSGPVTVNLQNTNVNAGTLPSSVVVPVGGAGAVTFTPVGSGQTTTVTALAPAGFGSTAPGSSPGSVLTIEVE